MGLFVQPHFLYHNSYLLKQCMNTASEKVSYIFSALFSITKKFYIYIVVSKGMNYDTPRKNMEE